MSKNPGMGQYRKTCKACGQFFWTNRRSQECCDDKCRARFWRMERPQLPAASEVLGDDRKLRRILRAYLQRAYGDALPRRRFHIRY